VRKKRPFNRIERWLLKIPTWLFVTGVVVFLSVIALWVEPDGVNLKSPRDIVRVIFGNAESIAIAAAVALYFKEIPDRKERKHYEAWQVIDNATGTETSYARRKAIKDLYQDGVSFTGLDLPGADLMGVDLSGANLSGADLRGADLIGAKLSGADLIYAKLSDAYLIGAYLSDACLSGANLSGANLTFAYLIGAYLNDACLSGANLSGAYLSGANLSGAYLRGARDLTEPQLSQAFLCRTSLPANINPELGNRDCKRLGID
jgi:hypothetical protein